jgi:Glycosyl transferases group 1
MRIAQVVLPTASEYERKCQRADAAALAGRHEVVSLPLEEVRGSGADVVHVYATEDLPRAPFVGFPVPYVSSAELKKARWSFRKPVEPEYLVTPFEVPEAVEDAYFEAADSGQRAGGSGRVIGTFRRAAVMNAVEQSFHRIHRTRDDLEWRLFERPPSLVDLMSVDIWVDPAVSENDYDGFVAEGLVAGLPVVASRTKINEQRLEKGRTGLLVPPGDPNELTHAILSALFKPEVASNKVTAARQTASKFRARQRLRVLLHMYETLIR